jgi:hypothetical protein
MKMLGLPNRLGCLQNNSVRLLIGAALGGNNIIVLT